jgi:hypothetical protein
MRGRETREFWYTDHEEVELLASRVCSAHRRRHGQGPHRYLHVDAWELVHGGVDAVAGDMCLEQELVQRCTAMASFSLSQPGPTATTPETKLGFEAAPTTRSITNVWSWSITNAWSIRSRERYPKEATAVGIKGRLSSNPYLAPSMEAGGTDLEAVSSSSPWIQRRRFGSSSPWLLSSGSSGDDIPGKQQR